MESGHATSRESNHAAKQGEKGAFRTELIFRYGFSSFQNFHPNKARSISPPPSKPRPRTNIVPPGYTMPSDFDQPVHGHKPATRFGPNNEVGIRESWMHWDTRTVRAGKRERQQKQLKETAGSMGAKRKMKDGTMLMEDEF